LTTKYLAGGRNLSRTASVIAVTCCFFESLSTFHFIGPLKFVLVPNTKGSLQNISALLT